MTKLDVLALVLAPIITAGLMLFVKMLAEHDSGESITLTEYILFGKHDDESEEE